MFVSPLRGKNAMAYLKGRFGDVDTISTREFREFIGFSMSTDVRMRKNGQYPPVVRMPGGQKNARIFLEDVAAWIEQGGCQNLKKEYTGKKRGRPVGSKNKKKEPEQKTSSPLIEQDAEDQDQAEQNQDEDQDDSSNSQMTPKF